MLFEIRELLAVQGRILNVLLHRLDVRVSLFHLLLAVFLKWRFLIRLTPIEFTVNFCSFCVRILINEVNFSGRILILQLSAICTFLGRAQRLIVVFRHADKFEVASLAGRWCSALFDFPFFLFLRCFRFLFVTDRLFMQLIGFLIAGV